MVDSAPCNQRPQTEGPALASLLAEMLPSSGPPRDAESIPFVDLALQHAPLQPAFHAVFQRLLTQGDFVLGEAVTALEREWAIACGVGFGAGVGCGTDAIALGLQACGISAGAEVLLPANTFIATLIGVRRAGATPVLVDCDPHTGLIDLDAANARVTPRTKAVVVVHLYGQMVCPRATRAFAQAHNLLIFEDAAQAHLAERQGERAGSLGAAAAFSFYPSKNLGALGDGGMVVSSDEAIASRVKTLRNYGAPKKYYHTEAGINSRLDTLQAAILRLKLPHLAHWNQQRYQLAQRYDQLLAQANLPCWPLENHSGSGHVYHLYIVRLHPGINRDALQAFLGDQGIQTGVHYPLPCHLQPAFRDLGYQPGDFPVAEGLSDVMVSLPMYPGLTLAQVERVVGSLQAGLKQRSVA